MNFKEQFDQLFLITEEMISGHGEDSFFCAQNNHSAIVSVFDGCGGLGSMTYPGFQGHSGAYIASRVVSGAVHDWYHDTQKVQWRNADQLLNSLHACIMEGYAVCTPYAENNARIRGSMVRDFPTTAAIALAQKHGNTVTLHVIWAGDSRVYLMDADGLAQLTEDDVAGQNALSNLSSDGALTNVLSSDGKFDLHYKRLEISRPTTIFAATDGCFGYIPTPMEFEVMLLRTLLEASNPIDHQNRLKEEIHAVTGDDFALGHMGLFYGSFARMQQSLLPRLEALDRLFLQPLQRDRSDHTIQQLWNQYRQNYERFL